MRPGKGIKSSQWKGIFLSNIATWRIFSSLQYLSPSINLQHITPSSFTMRSHIFSLAALCFVASVSAQEVCSTSQTLLSCTRWLTGALCLFPLVFRSVHGQQRLRIHGLEQCKDRNLIRRIVRAHPLLLLYPPSNIVASVDEVNANSDKGERFRFPTGSGGTAVSEAHNDHAVGYDPSANEFHADFSTSNLGALVKVTINGNKATFCNNNNCIGVNGQSKFTSFISPVYTFWFLATDTNEPFEWTIQQIAAA